MARKLHTMLELHITNVTIDHVFVEVVVGKKRKESIYILNVYSNPSKCKQRFRAIVHKASAQAGGSKLLACDDFSAMDQSWGYVKSNAKGGHWRRLRLTTDMYSSWILPTRREWETRCPDTTPNLTFVKNIVAEDIEWKNTGLDLGSDHMIVETTVQLSGASAPVDWEAFRRQRNETVDEDQQTEDICAWMKNVTGGPKTATREIKTDVQVDDI